VKLPNYYRRALSSGLIFENFYFTDYYVVTPLSCSSGSFMNYIIILNIFNTIHKLKDFFIKITGKPFTLISKERKSSGVEAFNLRLTGMRYFFFVCFVFRRGEI
jgi:hypothetical protein